MTSLLCLLSPLNHPFPSMLFFVSFSAFFLGPPFLSITLGFTVPRAPANGSSPFPPSFFLCVALPLPYINPVLATQKGKRAQLPLHPSLSSQSLKVFGSPSLSLEVLVSVQKSRYRLRSLTILISKLPLSLLSLLSSHSHRSILETISESPL